MPLDPLGRLISGWEAEELSDEFSRSVSERYWHGGNGTFRRRRRVCTAHVHAPTPPSVPCINTAMLLPVSDLYPHIHIRLLSDSRFPFYDFLKIAIMRLSSQILAASTLLATVSFAQDEGHGADEADLMGPAAFMWPADRIWNEKHDNSAPCGSSESPGTRTKFPLGKFRSYALFLC